MWILSFSVGQAVSLHGLANIVIVVINPSEPLFGSHVQEKGLYYIFFWNKKLKFC